MTKGKKAHSLDRPGRSGDRSEAERRKRTSDLAAAGGLANVGVIAAYQGGMFAAADLDILQCRHEVVKRTRQALDGNTVHMVGLLTAQALALNSIFAKLAIQAAEIDERNPRQMEAYLRLALKAQSQSRATIEAVMAVGNPPVLFTQQANVAFGPQQVNNNPTPSPANAGRTEPLSQPNRVLEADNGERLDTRAQDASGGDHQDLAAVGEVNGTAYASGQIGGFAQRFPGRAAQTVAGDRTRARRAAREARPFPGTE